MIVFIALISFVTYYTHLQHNCRLTLPENGKIRLESYHHSEASRAGNAIYDHACSESEQTLRNL